MVCYFEFLTPFTLGAVTFSFLMIQRNFILFYFILGGGKIGPKIKVKVVMIQMLFFWGPKSLIMQEYSFPKVIIFWTLGSNNMKPENLVE